MKKFLSHFSLLTLLFSFSFISCSSKDKKDKVDDKSDVKTEKSNNLRKEVRFAVGGSETLSALSQKWAQEYMDANPHVDLQVNGGGSGVGFASLINGGVHIVNASREISEREKQSLEKQGRKIKEFAVAIEGVAIYVNENNPVTSMSLEQLKDIYIGNIKNWKVLGGNNSRIITYGRDTNSGTRAFFKRVVLQNQDFMPGVQSLLGTSTILLTIMKDENSIGYTSKVETVGTRPLKLKVKTSDSTSYEPTQENVESGNYPLVRNLYVYTDEKIFNENPDLKGFIEYIIGDKGQSFVNDFGYYRIKS